MTNKPGLSLGICAHYNLSGTLSSGRNVCLLNSQFSIKSLHEKKPVVKVHHMKCNEVLEFLVRWQLNNVREVYLGLEGGVCLLVQTVPGSLPLKPLVNLSHSWLKC